MRKNNNGFTIVEIVVTVVVISILVSVAFFGYTRVQIDARNSERSSKTKIITEALESYYAKNGEYPSCSAMTQSSNLVSTNVLKGIETDVLKAPMSPSGTNSITCTALTNGAGSDAYAYVGDGSTTCSSGAACLQYTLQYRDESTGQVVSIDSKHRTQIAATTGSTIAATTVSNTQINLSWSAVGNATGYQLQQALDSNFTSSLVTSSPSGTTAPATGLVPGETYYFRVAPIGSTGQGTWSNTANAVTTISAPSGTPVMTASIVGSNAQGDITGTVTCASGTVQYQIRSRSTATASTGSWTPWSAWASSTTQSIPASQGFQYGFQTQAQCMGPDAASATSAQSSVPTAVRAISTPAAPTYLSPASFKSTVHAIVNFSGSCPAGTSTVNTTFRSRAWTGSNWGPNPWAFDDWWTNNTGSNKNVEYWGKYACQTTYSGPVTSPESYNSIVVTP